MFEIVYFFAQETIALPVFLQEITANFTEYTWKKSIFHR